MNFININAGCGGFAEGFLMEGFTPLLIAEESTCNINTLKSRLAYHALLKKGEEEVYWSNLLRRRGYPQMMEDLHAYTPKGVICQTSNTETLFPTEETDVICGTLNLSLRGMTAMLKKGGHIPLYITSFINRIKPKVFVLENSYECEDALAASFSSTLQNSFEGYNTHVVPINLEDYGILQEKKIVLLMGFRKDLPLPNTLKRDPIVHTYRLKGALFQDLATCQIGEIDMQTPSPYCVPFPTPYLTASKIRTSEPNTYHHCAPEVSLAQRKVYEAAIDLFLAKKINFVFSKHADEELKALPLKESEKTDTFYRVINPNDICPPLSANISSKPSNYIYPPNLFWSHTTPPRTLSVREVARIQSFPDNFYFEGTMTCAYISFVDATPPLLSRSIANIIHEYLKTL